MAFKLPDTYQNSERNLKLGLHEFIPSLISWMSWNNSLTNQLILDYGCGTGAPTVQFLVPIANQLQDTTIIGIDFSPEMITLAKSKNSHPAIEYYTGNLMNNDEMDAFQLNGRCDKIISNLVIHYIKNIGDAMTRFYKLLKPNGGQFGFTTIGKGFNYNALEYIGSHPKWSKYMQGYETYLPTWYEQDIDCASFLQEVCLRVGFKVKHIETNKRYFTNTIEYVIDFLWSINPFIHQFPSHLLPELRDTYRDMVQENQDYEFTMVVVLVET